jgi:uncharacterized protein YaiE (UPF0345 family)
MEFKNATIFKKANIYYDGKVTSRTIYTPNGERKTLGIQLPGEYEFSTGAAEIMEILGGEMDVCLSGETEFKTYKEGDSFSIPANTKFRLIVKTVADYCCSYLD